MKFLQTLALIVVIAAIGIGVSIWQPWRNSARTITINGQGKIKSVPDVAKIQGGVEIKKNSANEAQTETSTKISKIIDQVKTKGIEEKDIKTDQVSAYPNYDYNNGANTIDGYIARTTITVTIRDISKGQEMLDLMTANGATSISGPNLTFSDEKMVELKKQAQEAAVQDARKRADDLAKAGNTKIGKVITITENYVSEGNPIPYLTLDAKSVESSRINSISPGEDEITAQITITYSLR